MLFSVKLLRFLFYTGGLVCLLSSCIPSEEEKSLLNFSIRKTTPLNKPLKADYESINEELIKKSCLSCHNKDSSRVSFQTEQDLRDHYEDIIFYIEDGCSLGSCMPPRDDSGNPKKPIPSEKILKLFKEWISLSA